MKRLFAVLAVLMLSLPFAKAQTINLGPGTPIQVKGVLGTVYGGTGTVPSCHSTNQALQYNDSVNPHVFQCVTISVGTGTVTSVSTSGTNGMFSVNVSTPSPNPNFTFSLSNSGADQIFTGTGAGTGSWNSVPNCPTTGGTQALNYSTSTHLFSCNSITAGGGTTTNPVTFTTSGGAAPGQTFNGSAPVTIDYHTVGAPSTTGAGASGLGWNIGLSNSVTFASSGGSPQGTFYNGSTTFTVDYHTVGAPSVGGVNAVGTWGIAITGNAGTATALASAPTTCSIGQWATGIAASGNAICGSSNVTITLDSGSPISATTCATGHTQALTGVRSTSAFATGFGSDPRAVTGWGANGGLVVEIWPDASNDVFDWAVCNQSSSSITPGAMTLNVGVK